MIRRALALTHTGFGRLLRHRLVGKHANPDLAAALHETRHGHAAGFNLPIGDPSRLQNLQPEIAECQRRSAPGLAGRATALLLAILHFLWHQHNDFPVETLLATSLLIRCSSAAPGRRRSRLGRYDDLTQNPPAAVVVSRFFWGRISPLYTQHFTPITP